MSDSNAKPNDKSINYTAWAFITGVIIFFIVWIYAMAEWGFLLGIMFGWIPALIAAIIGGLLWPVIAIALAVIVALVILFSSS